MNDPSPPDPVATAGGNHGATLGEQRFVALQTAADIWGALLYSPVQIEVGATFAPLQCAPAGALLGHGGAGSSHRDFPGAPLPDTWYVAALANSKALSDLEPGLSDIYVQFSRDTVPDEFLCPHLAVFYYGTDGNLPVGYVDFINVALHEIGHGLGFAAHLDRQTGAKLLGFYGSYDRFLTLESTGQKATQMTDAERFDAVFSLGSQWSAGTGLVREASLVEIGC